MTRRQAALLLVLAVAGAVAALLGLAVGADGLSLRALRADLASGQAQLLFAEIRAPRTLGALLVGALLGIAGALAQGVFRNPLADPYLLGTAAGASLGVVLVLAASAAAGTVIPFATAAMLERLGLVLAAFAGALTGVLLTLLLARGAQHTLRLLLAGVVVGVLLGALADALTLLSPDALRGKQLFLLGNTGYLGWSSVFLLGAALALVVPLALALARLLDALTLGEDAAASLGLPVARLRALLVLGLAFATAVAVAQVGLIGFVGLVAPHIVRRVAPSRSAFLLGASALTGGVLVLVADVAARGLLAPQEIPVGLITAILGGGYLLWLLGRSAAR